MKKRCRIGRRQWSFLVAEGGEADLVTLCLDSQWAWRRDDDDDDGGEEEEEEEVVSQPTDILQMPLQ